MRDRSDLAGSSLDVDALVDILDGAPVTCGVLFGSLDGADTSADEDAGPDREETLAQFDRILSEMERTV